MPKELISKTEVAADSTRHGFLTAKINRRLQLTAPELPAPAGEDTGTEDKARACRMEEILALFGVKAKVSSVMHGAAVSRFELELQEGADPGKIADLEMDIAFGMSVPSVRIEVPAPGKGQSFVEIPNGRMTRVTLREVLESGEMRDARSLLTVALGKDVAGMPVMCDLDRTPHLLLTGQPGSGKTVCIHAIVNSLLRRAEPDEVRMILIDPKRIELKRYNSIPHLLAPAISDPSRAVAALEWVSNEIDERFRLFDENGVWELQEYNHLPDRGGEKAMPRIAVIIDELADLVITDKLNTVHSIHEIIKKGRRAGVCLIMATQCISEEMISDMYGDAVPSRIAFRSQDGSRASEVDGADHLLGWGDMLYAPAGAQTSVRLQGCFPDDKEINRITEHVRALNQDDGDPVFRMDMKM